MRFGNDEWVIANGSDSEKDGIGRKVNWENK